MFVKVSDDLIINTDKINYIIVAENDMRCRVILTGAEDGNYLTLDSDQTKLLLKATGTYYGDGL